MDISKAENLIMKHENYIMKKIGKKEGGFLLGETNLRYTCLRLANQF